MRIRRGLALESVVRSNSMSDANSISSSASLGARPRLRSLPTWLDNARLRVVDAVSNVLKVRYAFVATGESA